MTAAPREERPPRTSAAASLEGRGAWWALGALSLLGYLALAGLRGWSQPRDVRDFLGVMLALFAVYGVALWLVERRRAAPPSWKEIVLAAIFFRLALVPAGAPDGASGAWRDLTQGTEHASAYGSFMLYDNDVWRYLWDGRVVLGGVDTYRLSPAEIEELADGGDARFEWFEEEAWASLHPRIGYPGYRTIYPPLAQAVFALCAAVAPASVAFFKLLLLLFDVCTCLLLADLARRVRGRPELVLIYAWNPLVIKELIGSAHVDAILIFFLVLSAWLLERGRSRLALAALGGAILIKLTPLLLIPLFWRRTPWRSWWPLPAVGAAAYLPLWGSIPVMTESLQAFARDWGFNAGPWNAFLWASRAAGAEGRGVADALSLALTLGLVARLTAWAGRRGEGAEAARRLALGVCGILGGYVLLSPTVMPWYLLWALPFAALGGRVSARVWAVVTAASLASYGVYVDGVENTPWLAVEFAAIAAVLLWAAARGVGRPESGDPAVRTSSRAAP